MRVSRGGRAPATNTGPKPKPAAQVKQEPDLECALPTLSSSFTPSTSTIATAFIAHNKNNPNSNVPTTRHQRRMPSVYLHQLEAIWEADKRLPSVTSRRAWALARDLNPVQVNNWWYRKKKAARKSGLELPPGTYDLDVGVPPPVEAGLSVSCSNSSVMGSSPVPRDVDNKLNRSSEIGDRVVKEEAKPEAEFTMLRGWGRHQLDVKVDREDTPTNFFRSSPSDVTAYDSKSLGSDDHRFIRATAPADFLHYVPSLVDAGYATTTGWCAYSQGYMLEAGLQGPEMWNDSRFLSGPAHPGLDNSVTGCAVSMRLQVPTTIIRSLSCGGTDHSRSLSEANYATQQELHGTYVSNTSDEVELVCNQGDPRLSSFTCVLCAACDDVPVFTENPSDDIAEDWGQIEGTHASGNGGGELGLRLSVGELPRKRHTILPQIIEDPRDGSCCLGGIRYSREGYYLGDCECAAMTVKDGLEREQSEEQVKYEWYIGCSGPWQRFPVGTLDAMDA